MLQFRNIFSFGGFGARRILLDVAGVLIQITLHGRSFFVDRDFRKPLMVMWWGFLGYGPVGLFVLSRFGWPLTRILTWVSPIRR